jgi:hypothetical protein
VKLGARSIRGSLGTYAWVSVGVTAALAVVLWLGPCGGPLPARVTLDPEARWTGATFDDGARTWELGRDASLNLPAGTYRVTLFDAAGGSSRISLVLDGADRQLGDDVSDEADR